MLEGCDVIADSTVGDSEIRPKISKTVKHGSHRYAKKVEDVVAEHIKYSRQQSGDSEWKIVEDDGEMKVFIRETEMDGITCDPIKATMEVEGISAFEICEAFFIPEARMLWETTLDSSTVIESLDKDTLLFHQKHRKVWPAAQRDTVALTHIRPIPLVSGPTSSANGEAEPEEDEEEEDVNLDWITVNFSVFDMEEEIPVGKCVRAKINGSMLCRTKIRSPNNNSEGGAATPLSRDQVFTRVIYQSYVDAGGWVPAAGVRALAKREYPRFVRKFSEFVREQNKDKPIRLSPESTPKSNPDS